MTLASNLVEQSENTLLSPFAEDLAAQVRDVLAHAVDGHRKRLKVYRSLLNLNEVVGTECGDRVLYELIQNAHDAHRPEDRGRIAVRLVIQTDTQATLYVANGGRGFRMVDVDAILNIATTAKEIGEDIGNKGLGFRSIEALTDDVRIFSRDGTTPSSRFDGYCFRFATPREIETLLLNHGIDKATAREVAATVPRYLVPLPLDAQPDEVVAYARRGYASVIVAPLRTADAVALAQEPSRSTRGPRHPPGPVPGPHRGIPHRCRNTRRAGAPPRPYRAAQESRPGTGTRGLHHGRGPESAKPGASSWCGAS